MAYDNEFLLVAADLALFHKRYGFSIKPIHRFTTINCDCTFEVDEKSRSKCFDEGQASKA